MTDHPLGDFTEALERELRHQASPAHRTRPAGRRRLVRLAVPALACAVLAVVLLVAGASDERRVSVAYGKPLILTAPPVPPAEARAIVRRLNSGVSVRVFHPDARLTQARGIPALGGTAYVATGPEVWCLTAPDPAASPADNPGGIGAVTCARTAQVYRYGIALGVGDNVVAALPSGATPPTLITRDGTRTLTPDARGLVVAEDLPPGWSLKLHAADGSSLTLGRPG